MYYPKSQIKTNLYTNGGEYALAKDNSEYTGDYYITSDNRKFTGKNPNVVPSYELVDLSYNLNFSEGLNTHVAGNHFVINDVYDYARGVNLVGPTFPPSNPTQIFPTPSEKDYSYGEIQRYFVKKRNEEKYIEIDQSSFISYNTQEPNVNYVLYFAFQFPWVITGKRSEVFNVNRKTIQRVQRNNGFRGFIQYFNGKFDQLFRYTPKENLYTDGTEFKRASDGKIYRGYYHIHLDKGPMEGRQHENRPHDFLIPISGSNYQQIGTRLEERSENYRTPSRSGGGY